MRTGGEKEYKASSGSEKESKEEREKKRERERESGLSHGVGVVYYERVN